MRSPRSDQDAGSATVLGVGLLLVLVLLTGLLLAIAGTSVAGGRAIAAADLGALAGAGEVLQGRPGAACAAAARVVRANGAEPAGCRLVGPQGGSVARSSTSGVVGAQAVEVVAEVTVTGLPLPGAGRWTVGARAVAGPVPADPATLWP